MQDARNQNSSGFLTLENNMLFALHAAQASANIITDSTQGGIIDQHLAKRFQGVNVSDGLIFAPSPQGMIADP